MENLCPYDFSYNYKVLKLVKWILLHESFPFVRVKVIVTLVCTDKILNASFDRFFFPLVNKEDYTFEKKKESTGGQFVNPIDDGNKTISQGKAKILQSIDTFFYVGTEVRSSV